MMRGKLIKVATIVALAIGIRWDGKVAGQTQTPPPVVPSFKASVDMVRIAAIVRDRKGRFVADLTARDFEILDGGQARNIKDFRHDLTGVSVAMLFDVSGSMEGHLKYAREAADHVMSWLDPTRDEAAVFTFDTHLDEVSLSPKTCRAATGGRVPGADHRKKRVPRMESPEYLLRGVGA